MSCDDATLIKNPSKFVGRKIERESLSRENVPRINRCLHRLDAGKMACNASCNVGEYAFFV